MTRKIWTTSTGAAALAVCALAGATVAFGAGSTTKTTTTTTTTTTSTSGTTTAGKTAHTTETALTGAVLVKVTAAAIAKVGGTVDSATTENDSSNAAAAYEAHVTKADGTHVTVILDNAYNVLGVESGRAGRPGHHRGHGGNGETALTGDTATKAKAAAVAKEGGTADRATTETDSGNSAAAYEVHVTKSDGSHVVVILDKSLAVLTVESHGQGSADRGPHRR